MRNLTCWLRSILLAVPLASPLSAFAQSTPLTALDRYVAAPDTNYSYRLVNTVRSGGATVYALEMTSQRWLTTNEVDRPIWRHWLTIVKPDAAAGTNALLVISGGSVDKPAPAKADTTSLLIAAATKSVVVELRQIPNQPLRFAGETSGRSEDALIAYTWDKFLRTGDERWPARLPMTKAAVRAMDAVADFCSRLPDQPLKLGGFFVMGASKRGWTTWATAAVDPRVIGLAPVVINVLNVEPSMRHHYQSYGFWAPAVGNYTEEKIFDWLGTPRMRDLMRIEDPYEYRQRFTMPKFIINACGDQFFCPDSTQFYWQDLPGPKYLRCVPNADHGLKESDVWMTLLAFYNAVIKGDPLPQYSWIRATDGAFRVRTATRPSEVRLWQATNPKARDFRLETLGPAWTSALLTAGPDGEYVGLPAKPGQGWTAYLVELTYPSAVGGPFKFTTEVQVIPEVLPHPSPK
jgi:PhoPQ-activated pathogenicity-related protein